MSVVVRRADVAEKTANEVDRLLTDTPANDDSPWLGNIAPEKEAAQKQLGALKANDLYTGGARVVAAEVWAKSLGEIERTTAQPKATEPAPEPEKPVAKAAGKSDARGNRNAKPKAEEKPVEAAPPPAPKYTSLLAAVDPQLGSEWVKVMEKKKAVGELKGQIIVLEAANDEKTTPDAQRNENKKQIAELEKQVDVLEKDAKKLANEFVPKAKSAAQKAPADVRVRVGHAVVNLRQAVDDADLANSAAALRYPLAIKSLLDSAQQMAKVYVADVIEEKTGKRPSTQGLTPGVTLEGGKVAVTLNGISQNDLGKLSVGEVTSEVVSRTTAWVKRAAGLLGTIAATKEVLELEDDVLGAIVDGFSSAGWKAPAATTIPEAPAGAAPGTPRS
jgi:hypothetical protein